MKFQFKILKLVLSFTVCFSIFGSANVLAAKGNLKNQNSSDETRENKSEKRKRKKIFVITKHGKTVEQKKVEKINRKEEKKDLNIDETDFILKILQDMNNKSIDEKNLEEKAYLLNTSQVLGEKNYGFEVILNYYCVLSKLFRDGGIEKEFSAFLDKIIAPREFYSKILDYAKQINNEFKKSGSNLLEKKEIWETCKKYALKLGKSVRPERTIYFFDLKNDVKLYEKLDGIFLKTIFKDIVLSREEFEKYKFEALSLLNFEKMCSELILSLMEKVIKYKSFSLLYALREIFAYYSDNNLINFKILNNKDNFEKFKLQYLTRLDCLCKDKNYSESELYARMKNIENQEFYNNSKNKEKLLRNVLIKKKIIEEIYNPVVKYLIEKINSVEYEHIKDLNKAFNVRCKGKN